ncbi:hypothetical protein K474DRAFT_1770690 [Panus rudis PR-1116 ss-1]|nr:hypothetical protein K474DRAFT_1770690 [Panus rudis PR-1116 ss-1]
MSVASRNPFALLEDDEASRPSTPPAAPKKDAAPAPPAPTRGTNRARGGPASRGGRYYQRGGKSAPREENGAAPAADDAVAADATRKEGRGRGRGRGRGDRGRGRGGRLDRHSATGKTDSEKKIHQGWGGDEPESELKAEAAAATDAAAEGAEGEGWGPSTTEAGWGAEAPADGAAPASPAAEGDKPERRPREEEDDNTLTLDEYLKKQAEAKLEIIPKLETRKANEGDDSIWKDAVPITKKDEDEDAYFVGKTNKGAAPKPRAKKDEKVFIEIDARFERPSRGGRGRGERGGERSRGGRGRGRGRANGNTAAPTLNVADESAFPSLS